LFDGITGHVLTFDGDAAQFAEESSQNPAIVQSENAQEYDDVNIKVIRLPDLRGSTGIIFEDFVPSGEGKFGSWPLRLRP
jgi:hypothetical protein